MDIQYVLFFRKKRYYMLCCQIDISGPIVNELYTQITRKILLLFATIGRNNYGQSGYLLFLACPGGTHETVGAESHLLEALLPLQPQQHGYAF